MKQEKTGKPRQKESWYNVVKLDHRNSIKPLSTCDQKLSIRFIVQEILSLQLVEINESLHISAAFYKTRKSTDTHFCHRLRLDVSIKPSVAEGFFHPQVSSSAKMTQKCTRRSNEQITSHLL
jgi:hypothetical protein